MQDFYDNQDDFEEEPVKEKKGLFARFRSFISGKKEPKESKEPKEPKEQKDSKRAATLPEAPKADTDSIAKFNDFLGSIETQLGRVDEQNKSLLGQVSVLKSNNEILLNQVSVLKTNNDALLSQINILTENNSRLTEQFNVSRRREKIAKTLAIISSILAIGLTIYTFLQRSFGW
ncbi:MAG: hypothetical protein FWD58_00585 [Firmicutes bacterium]|nr:hypothetical protein [Bacillota bacterium]